MAIKIIKPTSPARRQMTVADFSGLTKKRPEKRLAKGKKRISGRGSSGTITIRRRGGGHKRLYRNIDFLRSDKQGVPGTVVALEYDPNRSARIALVHYNDGDKRYILCPEGLQVGDEVVCAERTKVKLGNRMKLKYVPSGYKIYNLETNIGRGGSTVRSAGTAATLVGGDNEYGIVEMPSGEVRRVHLDCYATIGTVSNTEHSLISIGKAGRKRWLGRRPQVLGKSMNAVDHPHGGGEGHSPIGLKAPKTPWGKKALGVKTRTRHKHSNRLIIRPRVRKKRKRG
ncbi:50S ribosomal protein L2 [Candidatus Peregrinibacteria bacterium CG10_big_fil_rev_8_21_14_0_10_49_10]|nr:MAG: 50S ribosomal protein L2 [Candidatus Peregrinibacteria bacterium CG10_big_fil_rev_8_21_14_0_10_49_10]